MKKNFCDSQVLELFGALVQIIILLLSSIYLNNKLSFYFLELTYLNSNFQ